MPIAYSSAAGVGVKWEHMQGLAPGKLVGIVSHDKLTRGCLSATSALGQNAGGLLHVVRVFGRNQVPELYGKVFPGRSKHVRHGLRHHILHALRRADKAGTDTGHCSSKAVDDKG